MSAGSSSAGWGHVPGRHANDRTGQAVGSAGLPMLRGRHPNPQSAMQMLKPLALPPAHPTAPPHLPAPAGAGRAGAAQRRRGRSRDTSRASGAPRRARSCRSRAVPAARGGRCVGPNRAALTQLHSNLAFAEPVRGRHRAKQPSKKASPRMASMGPRSAARHGRPLSPRAQRSTAEAGFPPV